MHGHLRHIEARKAVLLGHRATEGLGSTVDTSGVRANPVTESRLCGQTLADAPGTVSATSATHGSLLEFHLSVTHPRVWLLLCLDFSGSVYVLCVSYL